MSTPMLFYSEPNKDASMLFYSEPNKEAAHSLKLFYGLNFSCLFVAPFLSSNRDVGHNGHFSWVIELNSIFTVNS